MPFIELPLYTGRFLYYRKSYIALWLCIRLIQLFIVLCEHLTIKLLCDYLFEPHNKATGLYLVCSFSYHVGFDFVLDFLRLLLKFLLLSLNLFELFNSVVKCSISHNVCPFHCARVTAGFKHLSTSRHSHSLLSCYPLLRCILVFPCGTSVYFHSCVFCCSLDDCIILYWVQYINRQTNQYYTQYICSLLCKMYIVPIIIFRYNQMR